MNNSFQHEIPSINAGNQCAKSVKQDAAEARSGSGVKDLAPEQLCSHVQSNSFLHETPLLSILVEENISGLVTPFLIILYYYFIINFRIMLLDFLLIRHIRDIPTKMGHTVKSTIMRTGIIKFQ